MRQTGITQYEKPGTQPATGGAQPAESKPAQTPSLVEKDQVISKEMQTLMEERNIKLPKNLIGLAHEPSEDSPRQDTAAS